jgi:hypothetical protein
MNVLFERIWTKDSLKEDNMGMLHVLSWLDWVLMYTRRGKSGGQVRDEYREEFDPGRGGFGRSYDDERDERNQRNRY